jgi:polyferredoxin
MTPSSGSHSAFPLFRPNRDGSPWFLRVVRITTVRIISQAVFFGLFVFLVWVTWFSRLGGYPASLFLEVDPLVGLATAISTHTIYRGLWRALFVLVPTLLLGRAFCNWMCPYGTLHHFFGWLFDVRSNRANLDKNRYRSVQQIKYLILAFFLVLALFGSLQIGLLDPICLLVRTLTVTLAPGVDLAHAELTEYLVRHGLDARSLGFLTSAPGASEQRLFAGAWFVGLLILGLVGMNLVLPRFFCRVLCPLGALLGVLSRLSLWRIDRDLTRCTDCDLCLKHCEGASDPHAALRKSECFVCFNCIDDCPEDALHFRFAPAAVKDRITGERDSILGKIREGTAELFGASGTRPR